MNSNIEMAIASLCDDIASNTNPEDNRKRADAILELCFGSMFAPPSLDDLEDDQEKNGEPEHETISDKIPTAGEHFNYNGMEFVALGYKQGGVLAVAAKRLESKMPYDENCYNDWRSSTLRKILNEEYIKNFDKDDLIPIISDLTADNGDKSYGTSEDFIALLSDDLYRKYRAFVPKYDTWVWTITPWSCTPGNAYFERIVHTSGALSGNYAYGAFGVAPACIFNPSIFK